MRNKKKALGIVSFVFAMCLCGGALTLGQLSSANAEMTSETAASVKLYAADTLVESLGGKKMTVTNGTKTIKNSNNSNFNQIDGLQAKSPASEAMKVNYGYDEFWCVQCMQVDSRAIELSFDAVRVSETPLFTMKIGTDAHTDPRSDVFEYYGKTARAHVYAYGKNASGEEVQTSAFTVTYTLGVYTPIFVDLSESGLETVTNIAVNPQYSTLTAALGNASLNGKFDNVFADFGFTSKYAAADESILSANDKAYDFYGGQFRCFGALDTTGVYTCQTTFYSNGNAVNVGGGVEKDEYKYGTQRIGYNSYLIANLARPAHVNDYRYLDIKLWPQPQGAEGAWLAEDSNEFKFKILPYDELAGDVENAVEYTLPGKAWGDIKVPLAGLADENGYVSRFIVLYTGTEKTAERGEDAGKYSMNMIFHNLTLSNMYNVSFDPDGGSATESQRVAYGKTVTAPTEPTKNGYLFKGWTLNGEAYDFNTAVTEDITLKAVWERYLGKVQTMEVMLGGKIGVLFGVNLPDEVANDEAAYLSVKIGNNTEKQLTVDNARAVGDGNYVFEAEAAAAQMTERIALKIVKGGESSKEQTCSIREYAEKILATDSADAKKAELVRAMLNYGAYAQKVFGVNTDNLANAGYETTLPTNMEGTLKMSETMATGVSVSAVELFLKADNSVRLYYTAAEAANVKATVKYTDAEGNERIYNLNVCNDETNGFYVEIPHIAVNCFDREYEVTITNVSDNTTTVVTFSVAGVAANIVEKETTDTDKKNVAKALYAYGSAAKAFLAK